MQSVAAKAGHGRTVAVASRYYEVGLASSPVTFHSEPRPNSIQNPSICTSPLRRSLVCLKHRDAYLTVGVEFRDVVLQIALSGCGILTREFLPPETH